MINRKIIYLIACFSLYSCSDYPTGYQDGYADRDKRQWVVFGRDDYFNGYHSGLAEKFQDDWILENPVDSHALHCPTIIVQADPLMFLPHGYKEIAQDIYSQ